MDTGIALIASALDSPLAIARAPAVLAQALLCFAALLHILFVQHVAVKLGTVALRRHSGRQHALTVRREQRRVRAATRHDREHPARDARRGILDCGYQFRKMRGCDPNLGSSVPTLAMYGV